MTLPERVYAALREALPQAAVECVDNPALAEESSLLVAGVDALAVARFLRDDPAWRFDFCSNASGIDWPEKTGVVRETVVEVNAEGDKVERQRKTEQVVGGYLEAVYHLYSIALRHGPLVLRMRTDNRDDRVELPSLTPVWRSCELQEREIFDLYGIRFDGHPDLRRLLMWEDFVGHPMRRDYVDPPDELSACDPAAAADSGKEVR